MFGGRFRKRLEAQLSREIVREARRQERRSKARRKRGRKAERTVGPLTATAARGSAPCRSFTASVGLRELSGQSAIPLVDAIVEIPKSPEGGASFAASVAKSGCAG